MPDGVTCALSTSRLIALSKANGGIRPIAIGDVFRRLVSKLLAGRCIPLIKPYLLPSQLGVGFSGACETITHSIRHLLSAKPDLYLLQIDYTNAFNSISRKAILTSIRKLCPTLLPWFWATYGIPSTLLCQHGRNDEKFEILSRVGVQQGDPLGPLLFCLGIQPLIEEISTKFPSLSQFWFMDDGSLVGTEPDLGGVIPMIQSRSAEIGLSLNYSKCTLWSSSSRPITHPNLRAIPTVPSTEGVVLLGCPIGSDAFILRKCTETAIKFGVVCSKLHLVQHCQVEICILRY